MGSGTRLYRILLTTGVFTDPCPWKYGQVSDDIFVAKHPEKFAEDKVKVKIKTRFKLYFKIKEDFIVRNGMPR